MTAWTVTLLLALTCASVQATPVRPLPTGPGAGTVSPVRSSPVGPAPVGVPVNPYASTDPRLNAVRPVLELLVTLRQVQDAARGWPVDGPQRRALAAVLARPAGEALDVQAAGVLHAQVLAALGAHRDAEGFPELEGAAYGRLVASAADKDWVAHVKKPFRKSSHVIQLSRALHPPGGHRQLPAAGGYG